MGRFFIIYCLVLLWGWLGFGKYIRSGFFYGFVGLFYCVLFYLDADTGVGVFLVLIDGWLSSMCTS